jgi:hypothetical protein
VEEAEAMMKRAELLQSDMVFLDDVLGFERFIIYIYIYRCSWEDTSWIKTTQLMSITMPLLL